MNELIKVKEENGQRLVSARELYDFLGVTERFQQWFDKRVLKYGFADGSDFIGCKIFHTLANQEIQDYAITIDMAKELSMLQNSIKGREARKYFIACENKLKEVDLKANLLLSIYNGGQGAVFASKQLTEIEVKEAIKPLEDKIEKDKPLVAFSEQILKSNDNILVRELAKIISDEVVTIGQNKLYDKLRDFGYIMKNRTEPYQKYIDNGYFVFEEKSIKTPYGTKITKTTKISPRGQIAIVERFRKELV